MIIPFSTRRRRRQESVPRQRDDRAPYIHTALAYELLPNDDDAPNGKMGFLEHLDELRSRIIKCCIAVAAGMIGAFFFVDRIVNFVLAPARRALPPGAALIYTQPGEAFGLWVQAALMAGVLLAAPVIMYQVWRFIAPALYAREKKLAIPFVLLTTTGAGGGAAFSHYILFPYVVQFFGTFHSQELLFMPRLEDVIDLYTKLMLGMCVVFQIPTVAFFLARMRLITARFLWRNFRYAILLIFIAAAVLTPSTDPWNQTLFAAPMIGLYVISIGIVWAARPKAPVQS